MIKFINAKQRALLQAFAETEKDTPGTVNGLTYTKEGTKVVMEDNDGLVNDIREALADYDQNKNKTKA